MYGRQEIVCLLEENHDSKVNREVTISDKKCAKNKFKDFPTEFC